MHIADILALRSVPAAGLFLTLTRRCPLSCAHCSTNSMLDSEEHAASIFSEFARTLTVSEHPEVLFLTGGEPLLRPDLVHEVVSSAHAVGTRVALITGLYYARADGRIPPRLLDALVAVDHVVVSQDVFHEVQVPRANAFATVRTLVETGQDVSFQIVGSGGDDPYLADVTGQLRREFADSVPALVARLGPTGRAKRLGLPERGHRDEQLVATPCAMAAWPVVTFDGSIVACCQQDVVDGPAPAHLRLGTAPAVGWPQVARLVRERAMLRALRTVGPLTLAHGARLAPAPGEYCGTCAGLSRDPRSDEVAQELTSAPSFPVIETEVARLQAQTGAEGFARRYGIPAYAHMVLLGRRPDVAAQLVSATAEAKP